MQPVINCARDHILARTVTDNDLYQWDFITDLGCFVNREDEDDDVEKQYSAPRN